MNTSTTTNSHHTTNYSKERQDKPFLITIVYIALIVTIIAVLLTYYLYYECKYGKLIAERMVKNEVVDVEKDSPEKKLMCDEEAVVLDTLNQTLEEVFGVENDDNKEDFWNSSKCKSNNSINSNNSNGIQKTSDNAKKIKALVNPHQPPGGQ